MSVIQEYLNENIILRDTSFTHRWYDAWGANVVKSIEDFVQLSFSAANLPAAYLNTLTGAGSAALVAGSESGELLMTNDAADNATHNMQLLGEAFTLSARYPTYFGVRFKISDIAAQDVLIGLSITDTAAIEGGTSDGLYFRKDDADSRLWFIAEKNSSETAMAVATLVNATYITAEYLYLSGIVYVYINGVQVAELADSNINFPNDEYLTVTLAEQNGEGVAKTMTTDWIKAIQIQKV